MAFRIAQTTVAAMLLCLCGATSRADAPLLPNGGFEKGLEGWVVKPGEASQVTVLPRDADDVEQQGSVVRLDPDGRVLGLETERLTLGSELSTEQAYVVQADLKIESIDTGVFAFSMYCFDDAGKGLKQIVVLGLKAGAPAHDWRRVRGTFGPGTGHPLPAGTASVCIRFSFYAGDRDCRGGVMIDDVALRPVERGADDGWPSEITADVGDLQVRFESRSFWTLYRIDHLGTRLCLDRWGSHYGSVVRFPDVGFIGSGHRENEDESILDLTLSVDGQVVAKPDASVRCSELVLRKRSRIRDLVLETTIRVADSHIEEHVRLTADRPTPVELIYHFMHPWTPSATEYLAQMPDGTRLEGTFVGRRAQCIDRAVNWSAVYDGPSGKGAVTYVCDVPSEGNVRTRYWDVADTYRKHYLVSFEDDTVPADTEFHYRIITTPFVAEPERWKEVAARVAEGCRDDARK